jgi:hypothetical protein
VVEALYEFFDTSPEACGHLPSLPGGDGGRGEGVAGAWTLEQVALGVVCVDVLCIGVNS